MNMPPDMTHPKIQRLIAAKSRAEIEIGIVERMLHSNGRYEFSGLECEYITSIHDILAEIIRNARRYLALREHGILLRQEAVVFDVTDLDAAADRLLENES